MFSECTTCTPVPAPPVVVLLFPGQEVYNAGSYFQLNCSALLHDSINTDFNTTIEWYHNGVPISPSARVSVSTGHLLSSTLQFSTLSSALDSGTYTCTVRPKPDDEYSLWTSMAGSSRTTLFVTG